MGVTTTIALLILDSAVFTAWAGGMFESSGVVCVVIGLTRFLLLSAGSYWLLGNCIAYTVLGVYLAYMVSSRHFLQLQADAGLRLSHSDEGEQPSGVSGAAAPTSTGADKDSDSKSAPMVRQATMDSGDQHETTLAETSYVLDMLTRPHMLLIVLTLVFTLVVAVMAILGGSLSSLPTPRVPLLGDSSEPQWVFGLGSLAIVVSCLGLFFFLGYLEKDGGRIASPASQVTGAVFVFGTVVLGIMMFLATDSYAVLASLCCLPAALVVFLGIIGELINTEFAILAPGGLGWLPCFCARGTYCGYLKSPEQEAEESGETAGAEQSSATTSTAAASSGTGETPASPPTPAVADAPAPADAGSTAGEEGGKGDKSAILASLQAGLGEHFAPSKAQCLSGSQLKNTSMILAFALFVAILVVFAAIMAQGVKPIRYPWYASGMILSSACIYVSCREYFGTLHLSIQEAIFLVLGLVLHVTCHIPVIIAASNLSIPGDETNFQFLGLLFAFFMFPALWTAGVALFQWKDEKWNLLPPVAAFCGQKKPVAEGE